MTQFTRGGAGQGAGLSWQALISLLLFAGAVRWIFYSGYFGSDEVTYTQRAFQLLHGDWSVSSYVGANRYGVNLPVALFGLLFGQNEFAAAGYSMLCGVAEVALVAMFGSRMLGSRAGWLAGLLLATLPVQVHFSGRLMADTPLALAVTASFLLFYDAETRARRLSWFAAGLVVGWTFWIKPAAVLYAAVFLVYPLVFRRFDLRWLWMVSGFSAAVLGNNLLFWALAGDFWFLFKVMAIGLGSGNIEAAVAQGSMRNEAWYYFDFLFIKIYHTGLLGYLVLTSLLAWWAGRQRLSPLTGFALRYVAWWGGGLVLVLSIFVISVNPIVLVTKQTNYMLLFVAPLCLLGGHALSQLDPRPRRALVAVTVGVALLMSALLQASVSVFTANSLATLEFARQRPGAVVYTTTNAYRAALFDAVVHPDEVRPNIRSLDDWSRTDRSQTDALTERFVVIDNETLTWGGDQLYGRLEKLPACWVPAGVLTPTLRGVGSAMVMVIAPWADALPVPGAIKSRLQALATPAPANVYRVPPAGC